MKRFTWVVLMDTKTRRCSSSLPSSATPRQRLTQSGASSVRNLSQWLYYQTSIRKAFFEATNIEFRVLKFYSVGGGWRGVMLWIMSNEQTGNYFEILLHFTVVNFKMDLLSTRKLVHHSKHINPISKELFFPLSTSETDKKRNERWELFFKNAFLVVSLLHQGCGGVFSDERCSWRRNPVLRIPRQNIQDQTKENIQESWGALSFSLPIYPIKVARQGKAGFPQAGQTFAIRQQIIGSRPPLRVLVSEQSR